jgi:hypothetical protein
MSLAGRRPNWLRTLAHAVVAAGMAGILAMLALFAYELATGPALTAGQAFRLFLLTMPAAALAPIAATLPILALGAVIQKSWRGPPPLAIWALAGAAAALVASLLASKSPSAHLPAAAFGAVAMLLFGYLDREARGRG